MNDSLACILTSPRQITRNGTLIVELVAPYYYLTENGRRREQHAKPFLLVQSVKKSFRLEIKELCISPTELHQLLM